MGTPTNDIAIENILLVLLLENRCLILESNCALRYYDIGVGFCLR